MANTKKDHDKPRAVYLTYREAVRLREIVRAGAAGDTLSRKIKQFTDVWESDRKGGQGR